jgi:hypothetical protein
MADKSTAPARNRSDPQHGDVDRQLSKVGLDWLTRGNAPLAPALQDEMKEVIENEVVRAYAPPAVREAAWKETVTDECRTRIVRFADLPTKAFDDMLAEIKRKLDRLEDECQQIRDTYQRQTDAVNEKMAALQQSVDLGIAAAEGLKDRIKGVGKPPSESSE